MNQKTNLQKVNHVRLRMVSCALFLFFYSYALAQKIDFSNGTGNKAYIAEGYTDWYITENSSGGSVTNTFDGVTITIAHNSSSVTSGNKLTRSWYNVWTDDEMNLIHDGIYACMSDDTNGGYGATVGTVAIDVTIKGLSSGTHTLQAYHNYVMNTGLSLPTLGVKVNGNTVQSGIVQSQRADTKSTCAKSFVTFNVASASDEITITYFSEPVSGATYNTTYFFINALEFDVENSAVQAQNPFPENLDNHANVDGGNITMSWTAAPGATAHRIYFGDNEDQVSNATNYDLETTSTTYARNGLNPMQTYYWRVDEVIGGQVYKGDVWSFRPRRDAFPGAEGYGRYAIGGRGGTVYHVTSLDDDAENPAEGTFRYGITKVSGPRTIVFDVGGVIHLKNRLTCSDPYVTIAGQTAPGNGIMLRGAPFGMASDGITRFLRLRRGHIVVDGNTVEIELERTVNGVKEKYKKTVPADIQKGLDGMGMAGNDHSIMDHCSISWTIDEAFSSRGAKHITLQNTLISEALNIAGHPNYDSGTEHGYAATIGGGENGAKGSSFHHNLLAHNEGRNWSMSGGLDGNGSYDGHHDMFNNVCYNWATRATDGGTHEGQFVNNYYKMGASTTQLFLLKADLEGAGSGTQSYYVNGNIRENLNKTLSETQSDLYTYTVSGGQEVTWDIFRNNPFFEHLATVESATAAYKNVLSDVGCNQPVLDNHDTRMVNETKNGTYTCTGTASRAKNRYGHIDTEEDSEGFDGLNISEVYRDADWDTDLDGIPDWFETAKGWSTDIMNNNNYTNSQDYYTDLELYLNWMALPHWIEQDVDVPVEIDLTTYFAGYSNPSYTVNADGFTYSQNGSTLTVTPKESGLLSFTVKATEGDISLTRTFNFHVNGQPHVYNQAEEYSYPTTISSYGNITWPLNTGGSDQTATVSFGDDNVNDLITIKAITVGDNITFDGVDTRIGMTKFTPTTYETEANDNNRIQFYVSLPDGYTFTPSHIYLKASKFATNGGSFDVSWYANGSSTKIGTNINPQRASSNSVYNDPAYSEYNFNLQNYESVTGLFGVKINVYNINNQRQYGFKDIEINGVISGTETNNKVNITLKETATIFLPFKKGNTTVLKTTDIPINNASVTLERTLSNEYWNSFCVPFDISVEQINSIFGGGEVLEFASGSRSSVTFKTVTTGIRAGVPCLFKPINTVINPWFENVIISVTEEEKSSSDAGFSFDGHFSRYDMATDKTEFFLSTDGKLYYPNANQNHLLGMRATFTVPPVAARQGVIRMMIEEDMVSEDAGLVDGLQSIDGGYMMDQPVYNLNGQKVGSTRSELYKGVYIVNGRKVIIR